MKESDLIAIEALLDLVISAYPELGVETDEHIKMADDGAGKRYVGSGEDTFRAFQFDYLLGKELGLECALAETGYLVEPTFGYGFAFTQDSDGNIRGFVGALIPDEDGSACVLNAKAPLIDSLIAGHIERPLSERIRVTAYPVRIFSQIIGRPSFTVRRFSQIIRSLRELIRLVRLEQGDSSHDSTADAADGADR